MSVIPYNSKAMEILSEGYAVLKDNLTEQRGWAAIDYNNALPILFRTDRRNDNGQIAMPDGQTIKEISCYIRIYYDSFDRIVAAQIDMIAASQNGMVYGTPTGFYKGNPVLGIRHEDYQQTLRAELNSQGYFEEAMILPVICTVTGDAKPFQYLAVMVEGVPTGFDWSISPSGIQPGVNFGTELYNSYSRFSYDIVEGSPYSNSHYSKGMGYIVS